MLKLLCLLTIVAMAHGKWDDFLHEITHVCINGKLMCGAEPVRNVSIQLMDEDPFMDDHVATNSTTLDGSFEMCGDGRDYIGPNSDPDLYMKFADVCDRPCTRINLMGLPKDEEGTMIGELSVIQLVEQEGQDSVVVDC